MTTGTLKLTKHGEYHWPQTYEIVFRKRGVAFERREIRCCVDELDAVMDNWNSNVAEGCAWTVTRN